MKENYKAWEIDFEEFYKLENPLERIKFLLNFAVLAPSSHNSQPWKFKISNDYIIARPDFTRALTVGDSTNRLLFQSLGCAVKNILVAADFYGYETEIEYGSDEIKIKLIYNSNLSAIKKRTHNHLIFSIPKRHTNRNPYDDKKIPPETFLKIINDFNNDDTIIYVIINEEMKNLIADVVINASIEATENKNFRFELSHYVKPNTTKSFIGMPCFGMCISTPVSFLAPYLIKFLNMNKFSKKKDLDLLKKYTPVFIIISTRNDDTVSWIKTGMIYEEIALMAQSNNINTAMLASAIQIKDYYKELQKILKTNFRPQAFFRLGYAIKETPHSPRLPADKIIF